MLQNYFPLVCKTLTNSTLLTLSRNIICNGSFIAVYTVEKKINETKFYSSKQIFELNCEVYDNRGKNLG